MPTTRHMSISSACQESSATPGRCVICLQSLSDPALGATNSMSCGHTLHVKCTCDYFSQSATRNQCPVCRAVWFHETVDDEEMAGDEEQYVSFNEAIRRARQAVSNTKQGKRIAQSLGTMKKWHKRVRAARRTYCGMMRALEEKEKAEVWDVIKTHESRIHARFERRHKDELDAIKAAASAMKKMRRHFQSTRTRIAKKFGYVERRW